MSCEVRKFCIIILYLHYVGGGGNNPIFEPKVVIFTARIKTQLYTKFANFTGQYFLHFTTFRNQSL
jgi:hypothetical protein